MTCQGYLGDFLALNVYTNVNSSGNPLDVIFLKQNANMKEKLLGMVVV